MSEHHEGDHTPMEAVARQQIGKGRTDYQGAIAQETYREAGWNGAGFYHQYVWTCRHSHDSVDEAMGCAKAKLARLQASERKP